MIATIISLSTHVLLTSLKVLHSVVPALEYVASYWTMGGNKIEYNTKHLGKGDPLPPYNGKLRAYNMRFCPYAQRTILVLTAKKLDFEVVNVNLINKPEWLTSKSAFGKVPALEIEDGVSIYESLVTAEYIDEAYPQRPLISKDPLRRAFDKIIIEAFTPVQTAFYKSVTNPGEPVLDDIVAGFNKALGFLQEQLKQRGTKFLGGNEPGFVDYMIWPWFERIVAFDGHDGSVTVDQQKYQLLTKYINEMLKDPAVSVYLVTKDTLLKFMDSYRKKEPNYDILLGQ